MSTKVGSTGGCREAALEYVKRGWSVIPITPSAKKPPLIPWAEFQERVASPDEVKKWFDRWPDANIGIVTGAVSGIIAVDVDGDDGWFALEEQMGTVPQTLTNQSGRQGGEHLIFAHPGKWTKTEVGILQHVDVRGDGGYIVAPPSIHANGRRYSWIDAAVAPVPKGLDEILFANQPQAAQADRPTARPRVTRDEMAETIPVGERDSRLTRFAGALVARGLDEEAVADRLLEINAARCEVPLDEADVRRIAASISRREAKKTRGAESRRRLLLEELHEVEAETTEWLWRGHIPLGAMTVWDGNPGIGKSTLSIDLAARVSMGSAMPDGSPGLAGHVILINIEDDTARTIRPRVEAAGGDERRITIMKEVECPDGTKRPVSLTQDMESIRDTMIARGTKLVVVDPLMAFLGTDVNSYSDQHVRNALNPLALVASEVGAAVVIVRHPTKNRERTALEAGGGSIGIIGAARAGFYVAADPTTPGQIIMACTKQNLAPKPASRTLRIEGAPNNQPRVSWIATSELTADDLRLQKGAERKIDAAQGFLEEILAGGPIPEPEVQRAGELRGLSESTLKRARKALGVRAEKSGFAGGWALSMPKPVNGADAGVNEVPLIPLAMNENQVRGDGGENPTKGTKSLIQSAAPRSSWYRVRRAQRTSA